MSATPLPPVGTRTGPGRLRSAARWDSRLGEGRRERERDREDRQQGDERDDDPGARIAAGGSWTGDA